MNLPKAIKEKRKQNNLTQTKVIELTQIGHNQLTLIEKGKIEPTINTLQRLCNAFECKLSELIMLAEKL